MKVGVIKSSTLARLGTWSPKRVLRLKDEVEARGGDIDQDVELTAEAEADIGWLEERAQRQRKLPMPTI